MLRTFDRAPHGHDGSGAGSPRWSHRGLAGTSIEAAVIAMREGRPVLVVDDAARESEGDVIIAAHALTSDRLAWMLRQTSGLVCAPMTAERADRLDLPPMVVRNQDARGTAYTVTVDARDGVTTGISAHDRAHTLRVLAAADTGPADLIRPGHILPLRARAGGILERAGHTEAAVELCQLAGVPEVAAIAELTYDDGTMVRYDGVLDLGRRFDLPVLTTEHLIKFRRLEGPLPPPRPARVARGSHTTVATRHGSFQVIGFRDLLTGAEHLALISGRPGTPATVRVHSECLTGEAFGSLRCDCAPQLDSALARIAAEGGAVIYLRGHEGRGIGLLRKLEAYRLQDAGLDTVEANVALGLPEDDREYGAAAAILTELDLTRVRLLTNNPAKIAGLREAGIEVDSRIPLQVPADCHNSSYLTAKRHRMGHLI